MRTYQDELIKQETDKTSKIIERELRKAFFKNAITSFDEMKDILRNHLFDMTYRGIIDMQGVNIQEINGKFDIGLHLRTKSVKDVLVKVDVKL